MTPYVLIWGGGDLASGVALRLHHAGIRILIVETHQPLAVRRSVSFAQAVYDGRTQVEDIFGVLIQGPDEMQTVWSSGAIPVLVDPELTILSLHPPLVLVDARLKKKKLPGRLGDAELVIGLGPGFTAGENCHAAIETNRGHFLGRVYWEGSTQEDTGVPGTVQAYARERVLFAPDDGIIENLSSIGAHVQKGDPILVVNGKIVRAPFDGLLRGLIHEGIQVRQGMKVGDVDPRPEVYRSEFVSEKSLAIGGGVLEAVLTKDAVRTKLWKA